MRKIDHLITLVRKRTKNLDYSSTSGISQEMFIEAANQAQDHLLLGLTNVYTNEFITSSEISLTADTEAYSVTDRMLHNTKVISVQYSSTGEVDLYYPLERGNPAERRSVSGVPTMYFTQGSQIYLNYIPSSTQGKIRVTYYRDLDDVDVERGTVNGTPSGTTIATTGMDITSTPINMTNATYICISDKYGNVMLRNGIVSSWSSPTITLTANVSTFLVGSYTLANLASGSITLGKYTTTYSKLPDSCEQYLMLYMQKRIMTLDESNSSILEDTDLKTLEDRILNSFADETRDVEWIPIIDPEIMY